MDVLAQGFKTSMAAGDVVTPYSYGALAGLPLLLFALAVWLIEWRTSAQRGGVQARPAPLSLGRLLFNLIPEAVVLGLCAMVAGAFILRSENHNGSPPKDHVDKEVWEEITNEWPVLMTADTLLALQAIIRLVLCLSATCRPCEFDASPLANEPAAFFLLANVSRLALLVASPWEWFHIDGPLGGAINFGFELLAFPLLLNLSRGMLHQGWHRAMLLAIGVFLACVAAWCNRYSVADPGFEYMDMLFSLSHVLEFLAAAIFLARTIVLSSDSAGAFTSFAHVVLPVQQSFSMYFLLTAFAKPLEVVPELVGAGRPFEVFEIGGVAQVGMYLFAAVLHFVLVISADTKEDAPYLSISVQLAEAQRSLFGGERVIEV